MAKTAVSRGNNRGPTGATGVQGPKGDTGAQGPSGVTTLRGATDYDNSVAPVDGQVIGWWAGGGTWQPQTVVSQYQRAPIGGTAASTLVTQTYSLDATGAIFRRFTLTGNPTLSVPTGGVDGQKMTFWLGASGADRTFTFASGYEVSAVIPSRSIVIASGTWERIEVECRNGTWRLIGTDQLLFAPADIGAAAATHASSHRAGGSDPLMGAAATVQASSTTNATSVTTAYAAVPNTGVVFVAPPSGKVVIEVSAALLSGAANAGCHITPVVLTGATIGAGTSVLAAADANSASNYATSTLDGSRSTLLTGLTPGASYNAQAHLRSGTSATATTARQRVVVTPQLA